MDEVLVKEFFKRRFGKTLDWFGKGIIDSYYLEWVKRFESGNPEAFMDNESKRVYAVLKRTYLHKHD